GFVMKSETYSPCPQCTAQRYLRFRMFAFDPGHDPAALGRRVEASRFFKAGDMDVINFVIIIVHNTYITKSGCVSSCKICCYHIFVTEPVRLISVECLSVVYLLFS